jgi:hypothetical protein
MSRTAAVLLGCLLFCSTSADARADDDAQSELRNESAGLTPSASQTSDSPPDYQAAADLGLAEFERGNYLEARARFTEAHRLWPNARSLRALGYCEYELKNYVASLDLLRQALASTVRPLNEAQRVETTELIARARGYVARYTFNVFPRDARLTIDGVVPALDAEGALTLPVGAHTLEAQATGHQPARLPLQVASNVDRTIAVTLEPVPGVERAHQEQPLRKKWWLWTSVGAVVVAGVTGGLVAGLRDPGTRSPSGGNSGILLAARPSSGEQ